MSFSMKAAFTRPQRLGFHEFHQGTSKCCTLEVDDFFRLQDDVWMKKCVFFGVSYGFHMVSFGFHMVSHGFIWVSYGFHMSDLLK